MHLNWASRGAALLLGVALLALLSVTRAAARTSAATPPQAGPVVPPEFEPISQLLVTWPDDVELADFIGELVGEASKSVEVVIALRDDLDRRDVLDTLRAFDTRLRSIRFVTASYESMWIRDFGPLRLRSAGSDRVVEFRYFGARDDDDLAGALSKTLWSVDSVELPLEFETGNLLSNGAGICLTTDQIFEHNRGVPASQLRAIFRARLGCRELIILPRLDGEGTGHVDMFASFVDARRVLVASFERREDRVNSKRLDRTAEMLERAGLEVIRVPMADSRDGVFRTYTNTALINNLVLVPVYAGATAKEREALDIIRAAFPERRVVPIDATAAIELGGAIHCVTLTIR